MLEQSAERILREVGERSLVLDVGGWAKPFPRADWVIDLHPHATRGLYDYDRESVEERFGPDTWVQRDICDRQPWPFAERQFDFAVCAQTLEDLRDPLWVCAELTRVARAGYIEVPSRLEEQSLGVDGAQWAGWSHHRWLCDVDEGAIRFVHKPHHLHARADRHLSAAFLARLSPTQRVAALWWRESFSFTEEIFTAGEALDAYLREPVLAHEPARVSSPGSARGWRARARRRRR
ncbi:MAG: class I SAM-dependent methyltransferase [Actinobacteria bacterium]|nr:MAG: class I SAM-dependent methyltransferase [Actinomycetota bacterium]